MEKILEDLGLTPNEIKLYLTLLELGENTVGPLIDKLKIHRQVAYDALDGLIRRSLVIKTTKNNRYYFRISDPENIMSSIKYQEQIAKKFIRQVNKQLAGEGDRQEVKIIEGEKAYTDWVLQGSELMPEGSELFIVASGLAEWEELMTRNQSLTKLNETRERRNIHTKMIYNEKAREKISQIKKTNYENRFISSEYILPTEFAITPVGVELVSFGSDLLATIIKSIKLRGDYLNYFNKLWSIAKP